MWTTCPSCDALRPRDAAFCPNCAPRSAAWSRWFRAAVGAAGIGILGGVTAGCAESPLTEPPTDGAAPDSGLADMAANDGSRSDAGVMFCFCPILAAYGNFPICNQTPVAPDTNCAGGKPECVVCPPK